MTVTVTLITVEGDKETASLPSGSDLLNADLPSWKTGCTRGNCGVCKLEVLEGSSNLTKKSKLEAKTLATLGLSGDSYRLGCQCALNGDVKFRTI